MRPPPLCLWLITAFLLRLRLMQTDPKSDFVRVAPCSPRRLRAGRALRGTPDARPTGCHLSDAPVVGLATQAVVQKPTPPKRARRRVLMECEPLRRQSRFALEAHTTRIMPSSA